MLALPVLELSSAKRAELMLPASQQKLCVFRAKLCYMAGLLRPKVSSVCIIIQYRRAPLGLSI